MQEEVKRLRDKLHEGRQELFPATARLDPCRELLESHAQLLDQIIREIYEFSCRSADGQAARTSRSAFAIVATGGYGRRELNPFSDVDIAFIPSEESDPWLEAAVHMAFKLVMDVFLSFREIRVGYAFRPVAEASTWDLRTLTALLDARYLCGDETLADALREQVLATISALDLILEIRSEQERDKGIPGVTMYSVEPDLKEGPGSLRTLHRSRWLLKLFFKADDANLFEKLEQARILSSAETTDIQAAAEWFWSARNWLHLVTGKHADTLINNYQDRIAREFGFATAQQWLNRHYEHTETLIFFRERAVRTVLDGPLNLGGVKLDKGYLGRDSALKESNSDSTLKMFNLSQRYQIPVNFHDMNVLEARRGLAARESDPSPEECWAFLNILGGERQVSGTLRTLARLGMMDRFIDRFSELMRFVPPDPAHRYTVGEHSLRIIECLESLRRGGEASSQRFHELLSSCSYFNMLCLAALLHDAGKMLPGREHSEAGMGLARVVAQRLGLSPEQREVLEVLVLQHLLLVRTARLQDLKYPGVIQSVVEKVPSVEALRHLYVFTYVDTRAVAEKNWTSMDYRDLEELYKKVHGVLSGEGAEARTQPVLEDRIGQIRRRLVALDGTLDENAVQKHCDAMPSSYVLNTPLDEIAFHIQLLNRLDSERVVLDIYNRPGDDYSELTICTYDEPQPGLLAKIAGVLYSCNADIHKAQVFTMGKDHPIVLDTLWVRSLGTQLSENRAGRIQAALKDVLTQKLTLENLLKAAGKSPPRGIPLDSIDLRNDLSEEHTVVHVVARDLHGLLYLMTRAVSRAGLHIHSAKVATWAARAENNFYVTTLAGGPIPIDELPRWKTQLKATLQGVQDE
jgi:[protein-PII] uridylyltransferase